MITTKALIFGACNRIVHPDAGGCVSTSTAWDVIDDPRSDVQTCEAARLLIDASELCDPQFDGVCDNERGFDPDARRRYQATVLDRIVAFARQHGIELPPELKQWAELAPISEALAVLSQADTRGDPAMRGAAIKRLRDLGADVAVVPFSIRVRAEPSDEKAVLRFIPDKKTTPFHTDLIDPRSDFQRRKAAERALERAVARGDIDHLVDSLAREIERQSCGGADETPRNTGNNEVSSARRHVGEPKPYPLDALPEPIRGFVSAGAKAIGVDPAYVGTAILPALASAIGNAAVIRLKPGWTEPSVLWAALVGESGTLKSPVLDLVMRPIRQRQARAIAEYKEAEKTYERDKALYEADKKSWQSKGRAKMEPPPAAPSEPVCVRHYCSDATVEALAVLLEKNPRGVLLSRDELSGWLRSFDQYRNGRGGDSAHWLTMFGARDLVVDRKSNGQKPIYCPRANVSILGGIQLQTLRRALGREHFENGMAARLLLAMPPVKVKRWTEAAVDGSLHRAVDRVFDGLYELPMDVDADGRPQPVEIGLSRDGKAAWVEWYSRHARRLADAQGDHAAMLSKIEGAAARIALIVHLVRMVAGDPTLRDADAVEAASIGAGCALADWYANEAERVYCVLVESEEDQADRELIEWIRRKGGSVTARDLQRSLRRYNDGAAAENALRELVAVGVGVWADHLPEGDGGRPTRVFRLTTQPSADADETPEIPEKNEVSSARLDDINAELAGAAAEQEGGYP